MSKQSCKTCRHLYVLVDIRGRIIVRDDRTYSCEVVVPMPPLPDCVTQAQDIIRYRRVFMRGIEGVTCPTWEERVKS